MNKFAVLETIRILKDRNLPNKCNLFHQQVRFQVSNRDALCYYGEGILKLLQPRQHKI